MGRSTAPTALFVDLGPTSRTPQPKLECTSDHHNACGRAERGAVLLSLDKSTRALAGQAVRFNATVSAFGPHKVYRTGGFVALESIRLGRGGPVIAGHCWTPAGSWSSGLRRGRQIEGTANVHRVGDKLGLAYIRDVSDL